MKKNFLILIILLGVVLSSCLEAPFINSSNGTLVLNISLDGNNSRFSTIAPTLDIDHYVIDFTTFNETATEKEDVVINVKTSIITLSPGMWGIIIYAENSEGTRIAEVELPDIEIVKGEQNLIDAILLPVSGNGAISISLDLSAKPDEVTISSVTYNLEKGIISPESVSIGTLSEPYLVNLNCVSGSDYRLSFEITTDSGPIISEGIIHVYAGVTTTDTVVLSAVDFGDNKYIIADHSIVDRYDDIPSEWITEVKKMLLIIGGESHGRAYNYGLDLFELQDSKYAVNTQWSGVPESYTDQHLRSSRMYRFNNSWKDTMGEEYCFTNTPAIESLKTGLTYISENYTGKIVQGFGWCWDMTWHNNPTEEKDPIYGCGWAGSSVGAIDDLPWGLDDEDNSITGNSVNLQTYLNAVVEYNNYEPDVLFIYTTGPVDGAAGEGDYQRYLKHEYIRDWVKSNGGVLLDYADILSWDYDLNKPTTANWNDNTFPSGNIDLATGGSGYDGGDGGCHISGEGCLQLAKAVWWMLARIAGWDGE